VPPAPAALSSGYQLAFALAAVLALHGAVLAVLLLRAASPQEAAGRDAPRDAAPLGDAAIEDERLAA
jgi:hypothetical protein